MGRVSDAMSRIGYDSGWRDGSPAEPSGGREGEPFISGEEPEVLPHLVEEQEQRVVAAAIPQPTPYKPVEAARQRPRPATSEATRREPGSNDDVRIADVMGILLRHAWLIAIVVALSAVAAAVYNERAIPLFEARGRLIIEPNSPEVAPFRGAMVEDQGRVDYYVTQIEILRSRALVGRTLAKLGLLAADPKAQTSQVSGFLGGLGVSPVKSEMGETRVLNITYRSPDPDLAARFVNGLSQTYVDQNLESRRQGSRSAFESLNQRLAELRQDVSATQGAVQHYREKTDSVSLGDQQNIVTQKLAQLNSALTNARMERLERQTLYEQLKKIRQEGAPLDTFSPILSNTFVQGLKAELAGLQRERAQLSERLGDAHPDMIKVNTLINSAERRLSDEMAKIVQGIENDYLASQTREKAMSDSLESQKREVLELSQKSIGFSALQRDAASTQQMFDAVLQRVKETEISSELQTNNARILDAAEVPRAPIWPRKQINLLVAIVGGALLSMGLSIVHEHLNPRLFRRDDITAALGLPVLGTAPKMSGVKAQSGVDTLPPSFQEAVRAIRTRILLSTVGGAARALAVTSTHVGEGKTVMSTALAASMARAGRRVLLVDADMRRPQLHQKFTISRSPGLSDVLTNRVRLDEAVVASSVPELFVLPAGDSVASSTEALDSQRLSLLIQEFSQHFDMVILDCPPVMPVADAAIIAHAAGSVVFVVGSGKTNRRDAHSAIDRLASVQVQVIGVVLNKARPESASAYDYQPSLTERPA